MASPASATATRREARFSDPFGVAIAQDGTIYVSDAGDTQRIRRLSPDGAVSTLAGGERGFSDGVGARGALQHAVWARRDAAGTLYVADTGNNAIRRIAPDGTVSTLAGDGVAGYRDGPGAASAVQRPGRRRRRQRRTRRRRRHLQRSHPRHRARRLGLTLAGGEPGVADGAAPARSSTRRAASRSTQPERIYVADTGNGVIRIDLARRRCRDAPARRSSTRLVTRSASPIGAARRHLCHR